MLGYTWDLFKDKNKWRYWTLIFKRTDIFTWDCMETWNRMLAVLCTWDLIKFGFLYLYRSLLLHFGEFMKPLSNTDSCKTAFLPQPIHLVWSLHSTELSSCGNLIDQALSKYLRPFCEIWLVSDWKIMKTLKREQDCHKIIALAFSPSSCKPCHED